LNLTVGRPKQTPWFRRLIALAELKGHRTQQEIADGLHVSDTAVGRWRDGKPPKPENVKSAARAYGVDALERMRIAYLSDGDGEATRR
jgi:transcriptional regulator with XRE-family HTH domain